MAADGRRAGRAGARAGANGGVDDLEEAQELLVAVLAVGLSDHRSAGDLQGGEQAGGAVADVVMKSASPGWWA